ncbi:MAG: DUF2127 domain-containing protein [Candidatus Korobacteraceae bacterium]|jgi:uncharacterized membrane protein (DUF2068 family)
MKPPSEHADANRRALRSVAALEFIKGLLVVLAGLALLSLSRHALGIEDIAEDLLHLLHLNPDWHISVLLLRAAAGLQKANHLTVLTAFLAYPTLRFVEAYGLWWERAWAEWLALISGAAYLPFEIAGLAHKHTGVRLTVLLINVAIVVYMAYLRLGAHSEKKAAKLAEHKS